ncbi:MAG: DegQ family serine endoprotease [Candidatus Methylacidiphilales bacterium]|nr:DegQ family serine endoprotease [Candidatus Methylacidiphilales bacterium]
MKKHTSFYTLLTCLFCLLIGFTLSERSHAADWWPFGKNEQKPTAEIKVDQAPLVRDTRLTTSFAPVIQKTSPSIVSVKTSKTTTVRGNLGPFNDPMFRRFFGIPEGEEGDGGGFKQRQGGLGSGVIVSADGYILTNNHVIDGADEIIVDMQDDTKRELKAKVVGTDKRTDLAVLKIEATGLPNATLGDSEQLLVGDVVLAIGNPFGVGQTVTMGIVSAKSRNIGISQGGYEDFIQTDASINQGNSGGALIDTEGRVIGINTAIISPSGGNLGIGFAIPINLARRVMEQLIKDGKVTRGYLGVQIDTISPDHQEAFELKDTKGALVTHVEKDGPAAKAGLQRGDTIVEINGKPVTDVPTLRLSIASEPPGAKVKLKVIRKGKPQTIEATLDEFPDKEAKLGGDSESSEPDLTPNTLLKGVEIRDLDPESRKRGNVPDDVQGVLVSKVEPESPAAEAGMRPGQIIQEIGNTSVTNSKEAVGAMKSVQGKIVRLLVWDRGAFRYLVIRQK